MTHAVQIEFVHDRLEKSVANQVLLSFSDGVTICRLVQLLLRRLQRWDRRDASSQPLSVVQKAGEVGGGLRLKLSTNKRRRWRCVTLR